MKKLNRPATKAEQKKRSEEVWKKRIILEKKCSEEEALVTTGKIKELIAYMLHGYAAIAYKKMDGSFHLTMGTLIPYSTMFGHSLETHRIHSIVIYWDLKENGWRIFHLENLIEWKAIV